MNKFSLKEILLELFFPTKCVLCGSYLEGYICPKCLKKIPLTSSQAVCYNYKKDEKILEDLEFLGYYQGVWEDLISKFKFEDKPYLARTFAQLGKERIENKKWEIDFITFVPMWKDKELKRGYNQSEILARFLGKELNVKMLPLLRQVKPTLDQKSLGPKERVENVKGAYKALNINLKGKNILLVDDVYTTGTTLEECARELKNKGANKIFSFVICRTLLS